MFAYRLSVYEYHLRVSNIVPFKTALTNMLPELKCFLLFSFKYLLLKLHLCIFFHILLFLFLFAYCCRRRCCYCHHENCESSKKSLTNCIAVNIITNVYSHLMLHYTLHEIFGQTCTISYIISARYYVISYINFN